MILTLWKSTAQLFCRVSLDLGLPLLMVTLKLWVWREKTTEVGIFSSHHNWGAYYLYGLAVIEMVPVRTPPHLVKF